MKAFRFSFQCRECGTIFPWTANRWYRERCPVCHRDEIYPFCPPRREGERMRVFAFTGARECLEEALRRAYDLHEWAYAIIELVEVERELEDLPVCSDIYKLGIEGSKQRDETVLAEISKRIQELPAPSRDAAQGGAWILADAAPRKLFSIGPGADYDVVDAFLKYSKPDEEGGRWVSASVFTCKRCDAKFFLFPVTREEALGEEELSGWEAYWWPDSLAVSAEDLKDPYAMNVEFRDYDDLYRGWCKYWGCPCCGNAAPEGSPIWKAFKEMEGCSCKNKC